MNCAFAGRRTVSQSVAWSVQYSSWIDVLDSVHFGQLRGVCDDVLVLVYVCTVCVRVLFVCVCVCTNLAGEITKRDCRPLSATACRTSPCGSGVCLYVCKCVCVL